MNVDAATRVIFMVGQPVAQTKTPALLNKWFGERDRNLAVVPLELPDSAVAAFSQLLGEAGNVLGCVVTIPLKARFYPLVHEASPMSSALRVVNVVKRRDDGRLFGDMLDGRAMVQGLRALEVALKGRSAYLVGCGGAGSAMAFSACDEGVRRLRLHDARPESARQLADTLRRRFGACEIELGADARGCDLIINASPLGMRAGDELPVPIERTDPQAVVVDAVTSASTTSWVAACRAAGHTVLDGNAIAAYQLPLMRDFFGIETMPAT
ncbi:MAG: hypothetical protein QM741_08225 [Rudaea sp.]|uniref:shikimate dehydrogenase family protein n=1 Tax=Rudaea sp. TaxID=2136325 RepID=UPI0039E270C6